MEEMTPVVPLKSAFCEGWQMYDGKHLVTYSKLYEESVTQIKISWTEK